MYNKSTYNTIHAAIDALQKLGSPEKAQHLQRFFKTGPGEYAEGDIFWGITVPLTRKTASTYQHMKLEDLASMLEHAVHEVRLCALLIMVIQAKKSPAEIVDLYLKKTTFINNWDLVDLSAPAIVGNYLLTRDCSILYKLAASNLLWERRIAMVSTYSFIKQGNPELTIQLAKLLINDTHDLIHKAVGWMLREVGKRCSMSVLEEFLHEHAAIMPRTMLRYSIEHMTDEKRYYFMHRPGQ